MARQRDTRRSFLTGRLWADAAAEKLAPSDSLSAETVGDTSDRPAATYLLHVTRAAMACDFTVYLNAGQYPRGPEQAMAALDLVQRLEAQLSVYREDSEVSRLNRTAAAAPVPVESELWHLLARAQQVRVETQGAFDITSGPLSKAWGFFQRAGRLPTAGEIAAARQRVGGDAVHLDPASFTVHFARPGLEINLGGIGKGYALDCCAQQLLAAGIGDFLIHGGHSSVVARGQRLGRARPGWQVDLRHPLRSDQRLAEVYLTQRALGTSGSATQSFFHAGRRYGHILDPRTGQPADQVLSSTVMAPEAAMADALATAFFVLGEDAVEVYCRTHPDVSALLVLPDNDGHATRLRSFNLQDSDWRCLVHDPVLATPKLQD